MKLLKLFVLSYPVFVVIDSIWLGFIMRAFYRQHIGFLTNMVGNSMQVNWLPALIVWALIVIGGIVFALPRTDGTIISGILWGALYGLILYGVYDLTNLALIKGWPLVITVIDILWGTLLNGLIVGFLVWLNARIE